MRSAAILVSSDFKEEGANSLALLVAPSELADGRFTIAVVRAVDEEEESPVFLPRGTPVYTRPSLVQYLANAAE